MLFHVQMQMTISSLERARTVFPSEWGAEGNRGSGRTFGHGCQDELCCSETFPEFKVWSVLHRRCREQGKGRVPRGSPQLFLHHIPLLTPEDQRPWPLNWFTCLWRCPLPSSQNACCQSDSIIHSSVIALNSARYCCRHGIGYSRNDTGGRNLSSGGLYSVILLMCILMSLLYAPKFSMAPYGQLNKN